MAHNMAQTYKQYESYFKGKCRTPARDPKQERNFSALKEPQQQQQFATIIITLQCLNYSISKALEAYYRRPVSKHDLKHSRTFSFEHVHATLDSQVTFGRSPSTRRVASVGRRWVGSVSRPGGVR